MQYLGRLPVPPAYFITICISLGNFSKKQVRSFSPLSYRRGLNNHLAERLYTVPCVFLAETSNPTTFIPLVLLCSITFKLATIVFLLLIQIAWSYKYPGFPLVQSLGRSQEIVPDQGRRTLLGNTLAADFHSTGLVQWGITARKTISAFF